MATIFREASRRLTLPTLLEMLSPIGYICSLNSSSDSVALTLRAGESNLTLNFHDGDNAKDEGYVLVGEAEVIGEVKICGSSKCARGCGCKCLRDLGYISSDYYVSAENQTCTADHADMVSSEYDVPVYGLRMIRKMANNLVDCYMSSVIQAILQRASYAC